MSHEPVITIRLGRRTLLAAATLVAVAAAFLAFPDLFHAQKTQEDFGSKMDISEPKGGVSVATSADGKYVYVAGAEGVIVSNDFGKTGSWSQTVRMK